MDFKIFLLFAAMVWWFVEYLHYENCKTLVMFRHKIKNTLYKCKSCNKLFRNYQERLYKDINHNTIKRYASYCPHCENYVNEYEIEMGVEINPQPKWAESHPDCPKINLVQHLKVKRTARQIIKNQKLQEDQKFFEDYNKVEIDFSWIENLKKKEMSNKTNLLQGVEKVNKEKIYKEVLSETKNVIKHGVLTDKILLELKMTTSLYEYIEVVTNYYDDKERPDFNNWVDVEGFGYGWRWLRYDEDKWHGMMSEMVGEEAEGLQRYIGDAHYIVYSIPNGKVFHFINCGRWRVDTIISYSNDELYY